MKFDHVLVNVLILAGARSGKDPVAEYAGVAYKVLAKVGGERMIDRVLRAAEMAQTVNRRILCGPSLEIIKNDDSLHPLVESGQIDWAEPQAGPSGSVQAYLATHPQCLPLLVTTGDHALLTSEIVDYFVVEASKTGADVAIGLVSYPLLKRAYPVSKRTVLRFGKEELCGCNLFLFFSSDAVRLIQFWSRLEQDRKRPVRLIRHLGPWMVFRYLCGTLTFSECLAQVGLRFGLNIREVRLPFPQAAIDVDKPEDLNLVNEILSSDFNSRSSPPGQSTESVS